MEWIFANIINSVAINGVSKLAMPFGITMAIIFFIVYIYLIIKIKKYNYINKDSDN